MVSAKTGEGFDDLKELISNVFKSDISGDYQYLVRDRHIKFFNLLLNHLEKRFIKSVKVVGLSWLQKI